MQGAFVPLIAAAAAFLAVLVWRVRPIAATRRRVTRDALREAHHRIEAASDGPARARALCDAAELALGASRGRAGGSAAALFLRAMRSDPRSVEVVERAAAALARRPHTLEALLWRYLAIARWTDAQPATIAALEALRGLYEGPLRSSVRARAIANARDALDARG